MLTKSRVFLSALAFVGAFAPPAAHAADTPDPQAAIRAQILGQPTVLSAYASVLDTRTVREAEAASLYDTYYDEPTGFVFVKLPTGWRFVGREVEGGSHEVFLDARTGFVFVKTSDGWHFITPKG